MFYRALINWKFLNEEDLATKTFGAEVDSQQRECFYTLN